MALFILVPKDTFFKLININALCLLSLTCLPIPGSLTPSFASHSRFILFGCKKAGFFIFCSCLHLCFVLFHGQFDKAIISERLLSPIDDSLLVLILLTIVLFSSFVPDQDQSKDDGCKKDKLSLYVDIVFICSLGRTLFYFFL